MLDAVSLLSAEVSAFLLAADNREYVGLVTGERNLSSLRPVLGRSHCVVVISRGSD